MQDKKSKKRIPTDGGPNAWASPFASLKDFNMERSAVETPPPTEGKPPQDSPASLKNRGRVDILRQTAHRGGKTVTVVTNFTGVNPDEKERLRKEMQRVCGAGGTIKEGRIEIQGDHRETVARILAAAGFRPVFAGG
jgi:translation initiation factor 1